MRAEAKVPDRQIRPSTEVQGFNNRLAEEDSRRPQGNAEHHPRETGQGLIPEWIPLMVDSHIHIAPLC
jgi:hypothetical protein